MLKEETGTTISTAPHHLMHFMAKEMTTISMDTKVMTGYVVVKETILYVASLVSMILKEAKETIKSMEEMALTPFLEMIHHKCCLEMIRYLVRQVQISYTEDLETIRSMEVMMMICSPVELVRT